MFSPELCGDKSIQKIKDQNILKERQWHAQDKNQLLRLMMPREHAQPNAESAETDGGKKQRAFRRPPLILSRTLLVVQHDEESKAVDYSKDCQYVGEYGREYHKSLFRK